MMHKNMHMKQDGGTGTRYLVSGYWYSAYRQVAVILLNEQYPNFSATYVIVLAIVIPIPN
jgi:hypothetical protein